MKDCNLFRLYCQADDRLDALEMPPEVHEAHLCALFHGYVSAVFRRPAGDGELVVAKAFLPPEPTQEPKTHDRPDPPARP